VLQGYGVWVQLPSDEELISVKNINQKLTFIVRLKAKASSIVFVRPVTRLVSRVHLAPCAMNDNAGAVWIPIRCWNLWMHDGEK